MKKIIKIAHLYYDLMNLYGESGNVKALKRFIEKQGVLAEIHFLTIGDKIDFEKYDFYYIGEGSEENQKIVLEDLINYKEDIKKAVENGKMFLATGNAMELFGKKIKCQNGSSVNTLGIFDYQAREENRRLVSDLFYEFDELSEDKGRNIVGFKNCSCNIIHNDERMFKFSDNFRHNNFFGMNFVGPVLIRNPYFTNYMLEILFKEKNYEYKVIDDTIEFKAYREYVYNFITNSNLD